MYNNDKGSILAVTVVAMVIMMVIGFVCLQMFYAQNIMTTYDQVKLRTFYSAEGAIELSRAVIDSSVNSHKTGGFDKPDDGGYLFNVTKTPSDQKWYLLEDLNGYPFFRTNKCFDGIMYPQVNCRVYCQRLTNAQTTSYKNLGIPIPALASRDYAYMIVAIASATHKTNLSTNVVVSTVTYFFITRHEEDGSGVTTNNNKRYFVSWGNKVL